MDVMRDIEDDYFDLAVVDPPYGIGIDGQKECSKTNRIFVGIELDPYYFKAAKERIQEQTRQQELF